VNLTPAAAPALPDELTECPVGCYRHSEPERSFSAATWTRKHVVPTRLPGVVLVVRDYWAGPEFPRRTVDVDIAGYTVPSHELADLADFAMYRELAHPVGRVTGNRVVEAASPDQLPLDEPEGDPLSELGEWLPH
jgi:hypothetical protein